ncbi:MAG: thiamine pyrophosphate-dependent enzyme [bacterium]
MTTKTIIKKKKTDKFLLSPGHRACAGCGQMIAARTVLESLGPDTIIANGTGCLEVTTTPYPESAWSVPWIHSLFENPAAVASGISAALRQKGEDKRIKVVAQSGDGGTFDIGFGLLSGMWERNENILFICYDNEAYSNTGMQASGATPYGAKTTTTPIGDVGFIGSLQRKKDMIAIALAHNVPYVAETTVGFIEDIKTKIKKARSIEGPSYIQILSPCVPGWGTKPENSMKVARLAVQTGLYPAIEYVNGELTNVIKVPQKTPQVREYLSLQGRFKHLFKDKKGAEQIKLIQRLADENIVKYKLK